MRGRPFLGFFAGLIFGVFLAITLVLVGVLPLNSVLVSILPCARHRLRPADGRVGAVREQWRHGGLIAHAVTRGDRRRPRRGTQ